MPENLLLSTVANAFIEDARMNAAPGAFGTASPLILRIAAPVVSLYRAAWRGLWVGGRVSVTSEAVLFSANAMNRAVQSGTLDVRIPLEAITGVELKAAFVTDIVVVSTAESRLRVRCYRAHVLAEVIESARVAAAAADATSPHDGPESQAGLTRRLGRRFARLFRAGADGPLTEADLAEARARIAARKRPPST